MLRVATWNIHKGIGGIDRRYDLGRVIKSIEHYAPDIVLLQEVAEAMPQLQHDGQLRLLREKLGFRHAVFHREHHFARGAYGNAILSHWPLHDASHVDLTIAWRKQRGALTAKARVRLNGATRTVVISNLHLGLAGSERGKQLERFLTSAPFRGMHQRTPLICGGDLNDLWGSLGPRFLQPNGFRRLGERHNTFPAAMPLRPLDGLFVRGDIRSLRCFVGTHELARAASDHLPIIADVDLAAP